MVTTIITAMAAYSNERVAAIVISVLYRMLTELWESRKELLKDLVRFFKEYMPRYGYKRKHPKNYPFYQL